MTYPAVDNLPPIHPGAILRDELEAIALSARQLAGHLGVPPNAVTGILNGRRRVTAAMALRLGKAFGTGERYWMNLQGQYEAKLARVELAGRLDAIKPLPREGRAISDTDGHG